MAATPVYGLRYPAATDRPTGDEQLQAFAEDVEAATKALVPDTGSQTNTPVTAAAGWEILVKEHRMIGKVCTLHLWLKRTGAALNASSSGNIGDTDVATIDDPALRPTMDCFNTFRGSLTDGASDCLKTGAISITSMHSDSSIATFTDELSSTVQLYFRYPVA